MADETTKEPAKAVQEVAKTVRVAIEQLGPWFGRIIGEPTSELVGMVTDRLKFNRTKRAATLASRYEQFLVERGITNPVPIPPKFAIPIIENASLEDDDVLFDLWSNLLLAEIDPLRPKGIRAAFIGIISQMDPLDAQVLSLIHRETARLREASIPHVIKTHRLISVVRAKLGKDIDKNDIIISLDNLLRLRCLETRMEDKEIVTHDPHTGRPEAKLVSLDHGADRLGLTKLGIAFVESCVHPPQEA